LKGPKKYLIFIISTVVADKRNTKYFWRA